MQKVNVNGKNADENWKLLKAAFNNKDVFWNFEKFLVDKNGVPKKRYGSTWSKDIAKDIQRLLDEERPATTCKKKKAQTPESSTISTEDNRQK